jgi:light-regulated signal transduction histidine kinase (bacteriophytochrome)
MTRVESERSQSYIVSNADDLLGLFDADFGVLVIGEGAKILGPNERGQEVLLVAEYLRLKRFGTIQVSQAVTKDFPDMRLETGLEVIAGLLYVPLSRGGTDFIALLRKGQPRVVRWAGKPYKDDASGRLASLEPRASFRVWSETVAGRCRVWTDEQLETAGVLAFIYGKVRRTTGHPLHLSF